MFGPSQPGSLRLFLTSNTGGGLVALASVLLIVVVLLAVRSAPPGTRGAASGSGRGGLTPTGAGAATPSGSASARDHRSASAPPPGTGAGAPTRRPTATPTPTPTPTRTPRPSRPAVSHLPLTVLNNTLVHGLAHRAAGTLAARGWPIAVVGNYAGRLPTTTVYYTPGHAAEQRAAQALARDFPKITRVLPHDPHLPVSARGVIVVIAPNWLT